MMLIMIGAIACSPGISQAAGGNDQDQIILLNDSAAALEDSNPGLSKRITQFADEKEKEWEDKNANKNEAPIPVSGKNGIPVAEQIKILKAAAFAIQPTYPLIAKGLEKMAKDINRTIEIEQTSKL